MTCFGIACKFSRRQWCVSTISISRPHRFHCYVCVLLLFVPASPIATADEFTSLLLSYTAPIRSYNLIPRNVIVNLLFSISVKKPGLALMSVRPLKGLRWERGTVSHVCFILNVGFTKGHRHCLDRKLSASKREILVLQRFNGRSLSTVSPIKNVSICRQWLTYRPSSNMRGPGPSTN